MIYITLLQLQLKNIDEITAYENQLKNSSLHSFFHPGAGSGFATIAINFGFMDTIKLVFTWAVGIILMNFSTIFFESILSFLKINFTASRRSGDIKFMIFKKFEYETSKAIKKMIPPQ